MGERRPRVETLTLQTLEQLKPTEVWVGFSGGVDSTAQLIAAQRVINELSPQPLLRAVHINHALQEAAMDWQVHCAQVCQRLSVELHIERVEVKQSGNLEANARAARYDCFARLLSPGSLLLLGHHQQDQSETILYRLFQGRGLLPMRQQAVLGAGQFARPLLPVPPEMLIEYVQSQGLTWIEDLSNKDARFERNYLRHQVLPNLQQRWHQLHDALARVAHSHAAVQRALTHEVAKYNDTVPIVALPLDEDTRIAWLRIYLNVRGLHHVADKALREFTDQLTHRSMAHLAFAEQGDLYGYNNTLYFEKPVVEASDSPSTIALGDTVCLDYGWLTLQSAAAHEPGAFVYPGALTIKFRQGGESLVVRGINKSLKQLFNEARVPPWRRAGYPLLYDHSQLVCVPGIAQRDLVSAQPGAAYCKAVWLPKGSEEVAD